MTIETVIPFSGFYESAHSAMLDGEAEVMHSDDHGEPLPELEDFHYTPAMLQAYCREYVQAFNDLLPKGCKLEFSELISPREYNFTTDKIICTISHECLAKIMAETDREQLTQVIKDRCTSYDGFSSFYSSDIQDWPESPTDWEPAQLELLLIAYLITTDQEELDPYDLMEAARCNGDIASIVELGMPA